jgi:glycosyltransferase involved in cell wall biosynthesis
LQGHSRRPQKKIAINGRFLSQAVTGVQRYAHELLRELDQILFELSLPPDEVEILAPRDAIDSTDFRYLRVRKTGRLTGQFWEQFELPFYCHGRLLFTPCGGAPLLHSSHIITIPDAAVFATPQAYSAAYGTWYRWLHRHMCATARQILTVSESSKRELIRWCAADSSKITVTPLGSDHVYRLQADNSILENHGLSGANFVLAVSSRNPNKNFDGIVNAIHQIHQLESRNVRFVLVGGLNSQVFGRSQEISGSIDEVGYVSDEQLRALYQNASCFVFPSLYEGFGLPPLEAMASGCPVVASDIPPLRETCGDAALYCDPTNPEDIARQIRTVLFDKVKQGELIEKGDRRARGFTWKRTARQTWNILQNESSRM